MDSLTVDLRHLQSAQNDLIEWAVRACIAPSATAFAFSLLCMCGRRTAREERIELDQQLDVRVIALGHLAVRLLDVVLVETARVVLAFASARRYG